MDKFFAKAQSNTKKLHGHDSVSEKKGTEEAYTVAQPTTGDDSEAKPLPKGVVLGKDGKP